MPRVVVKPLNIIRSRTNTSEWHIDAATLQETISRFIEEFYEKLGPDLVLHDRTRFRDEIKVISNGQNIEPEAWSNYSVKQGEEIYIALAISGG